jgi:hypothetical protein
MISGHVRRRGRRQLIFSSLARRAVLDAADLFARRDIDGVSLRDIAASCSATSPSPGDQDRTTASFNPVRVLARVL